MDKLKFLSEYELALVKDFLKMSSPDNALYESVDNDNVMLEKWHVVKKALLLKMKHLSDKDIQCLLL